MPTHVKVCINGFVLSTLLFDCANNGGDQEGFLYGSITRNVRREINDTSMSNTQEDILISICSSVPCGSFLSFYNNVGEIDRNELEFSLGDRIENIVGWYRYRRYSALYPSAREQTIHKKLRAIFAASSHIDDSYFVFGLLSSSNLPNFATHSFDYAFYTQKTDDTFKNLSLTILNLGDTRNTYRAGSMALPFMESSSFNSVLSNSWNFNTLFESEDQIQQFHQRLRLKLESLQEELAASDAVNASLEDDIRRLSNEMQTLLAAQEHLASGTNEKRVEEITEHIEKESAIAKQEESPSSEDKQSKDPKSMLSNLQVGVTSKIEEHPKAGETAVSGGESPHLKRSAVTPAESSRTKRSCPDKYFESTEYQEEKSDAEPVAQMEEKVDPKISSSKQEDSVLTSSQVLVVDPDSGEMSAAHSEIENAKSDVTPCQLQENLVPSPSSTVEIVISVEESGSSTSEELSDIKESPELSDVKEFNSESATSPKQAVLSAPSQSSKTVDSEHQGEMQSSTTQELNDKSAVNENILSGSSVTRASSSDDSPCKVNRPLIIYASKDCEDPLVNPVPSSNQSSRVEESLQKESSESKSEINVLPSSPDQPEVKEEKSEGNQTSQGSEKTE